MTTTETSGNHRITDGDDDEGRLARIEGHLAALQAQADHIDAGIHDLQRRAGEILAALRPLTDHPEAVAKGLSLLDPGAGVRRFLPGGRGRAVPENGT